MFKTCPEIHRDRPELNLHIDKLLCILQKDRNLNNQMKAAVSARLGIFYVIFPLDQFDIILLKKAFFQRINIILKRTDHSHARYIFNIFLDCLHRNWYIFFTDLFQNAFIGLHSCLNTFNRIAVILQ